MGALKRVWFLFFIDDNELAFLPYLLTEGYFILL